jgi:hypothetical protein
MRTTVATASATIAAFILMKPDLPFPDPMAKQATYGIEFHVKMYGDVIQRRHLAFY